MLYAKYQEILDVCSVSDGTGSFWGILMLKFNIGRVNLAFYCRRRIVEKTINKKIQELKNQHLTRLKKGRGGEKKNE